MAWSFTYDAFNALTDHALGDEATERMAAVIAKVEGVDSMSTVRTRKMGDWAWAEVDICVDPWLSVSEAHFVTECVSEALKLDFPNLAAIQVHVDTPNWASYHTEQANAASCGLLRDSWPRRSMITPLINEGLAQPLTVILHYGHDQVDVMAIMPKAMTLLTADRQQLAANLMRVQALPKLGRIDVFEHYSATPLANDHLEKRML
jgi:hypothetical protein